MHILIADKLSSHVKESLTDAGHRVHVDAELKEDSLTAAIKEHDPEVLVVRSTKVQADQLSSCR